MRLLYRHIVSFIGVLLFVTPATLHAASSPGFVSSLVGSLIGYLAGVFVSLIAAVMVLISRLFETLIDFTIVNFSANFATLVSDGVNTAWILFRDITNIMLIGVFVYIAFSVLLNIAMVNVEKLVVRVLVMAVLINFSLFASKVIIDISNISAIQFYEQIQNTTAGGLAQAIIQKSGVNMAFNTDSMVDIFSEGISKTAKVGKKYGVVAVLLYSLFVSLFLAALIAIFIYGSILLVSRALAFIFLMVTSPLAFAAWMVPGLEGHWSRWWSLMLRNAFFAPFLMLFLWASLKIMEGLNANSAGIISIISNPSGGLGEVAFQGLFHTVLVLGLLYGSIKIANSFALMGTSLAEQAGMKSFGMAAKWSGIGVLGQLSAAGAAWAGRQAIGQGARLVQKGNRSLANTRLGFLASARLDRALEKVKRSGMRLGDSEKAKELAGKMGVTLRPTLKPEERLAFDKGRIERLRERQAKKEQKAAEKTLAEPGRDPEKYRRMQQDQLQLYKNALEKEVQGSQKKIAEAGRIVNSLDRAIEQALDRKDTQTAAQLSQERDKAQQLIAEETEKIRQVRDHINKFSEAQEKAARGQSYDLDTLYSDAAQVLPENSLARKELDAIHQMQEDVRKQLMQRQYFSPEAYQVSDTAPLGDRLFDPVNAPESWKRAVKEADYPEHYKTMGGQFKDEAVATKEVVNRAIKTFAQKGTKYVPSPKSQGGGSSGGGGNTP